MANKRYPDHKPPKKCPACGHEKLGEETARLSSKWNANSFLLKLYICEACAHVTQYFLKSSLVTD